MRVGDFTDYDVSEGSPAGAGVLGSEAYFLGDATNALFRFEQTGVDAVYDGNYYLRLRSDTVIAGTDTEPSGNLDTSEFTIDSDYVPPPAAATPTITLSETSLRGGRDATATISWDQTVTDFTDADPTLSAGTLGTLTGSGSVYMVTLTAPSTGSGSMVLTIAEDAVSQTNAETEATIAYSPLPTATIVYGASEVRGGRDVGATFTFSESVTGFTIADLSVSAGTLSSFSGSGDTYTVDVTAPSTGSGNIILTLAEDAVNELNAETTATIAYSPLPDG